MWKDVMNFGGVFAEAYQVKGDEIWSKDRYVTYTRNGKEITRIVKGRKIVPVILNNGYAKVSLSYGGHREEILFHQIIAFNNQEICGTWFDGADIDHRDGNKLNNRPENLRYCTRKENCNNPITLESLTNSMINNNKRSKAVYQYTKNGEFVAEYPSTMEVQRKFGYRNSNISACCLGKKTMAYGFIWRYEKMEAF